MAARASRKRPEQGRRLLLKGVVAAAATVALAACAGVNVPFGGSSQPSGPAQPAQTVGSGQIRVGLILPLAGSGNAGPVAASMRNAAELAIAEFNAPNIQLLVKDDGGSSLGAQTAAQSAIDEGAEIILGPLFAGSVAAAGATARARNIPVIAFSTDTSVAMRGVYLLSFLPESDVDRIIAFAVSRGKTSFAAMIPENAYGNVVDAAFRQAVARHNARIVASERYGDGEAQIQDAVRRVTPALAQADALFLPSDSERAPAIGRALAGAGAPLRRLQVLGTGLWDDQKVYAEASLQGAWFAAPDGAGFRGFSNRYRAKFGESPLRAATLSYDAVSLVAALVKTQGAARFSETVLTNSSGFSGIDGIFRFRPEGTNQRGLAVLRVTPSGTTVVAPAPRSFTAGQ